MSPEPQVAKNSDDGDFGAEEEEAEELPPALPAAMQKHGREVITDSVSLFSIGGSTKE